MENWKLFYEISTRNKNIEGYFFDKAIEIGDRSEDPLTNLLYLSVLDGNKIDKFYLSKLVHNIQKAYKRISADIHSYRDFILSQISDKIDSEMVADLYEPFDFINMRLIGVNNVMDVKEKDIADVQKQLQQLYNKLNKVLANPKGLALKVLFEEE